MIMGVIGEGYSVRTASATWYFRGKKKEILNRVKHRSSYLEREKIEREWYDRGKKVESNF